MLQSSTAEVHTVERLLTAQEVADYLHVTLRTLRAWLKSGKLKGRKIGNQWLIKESAVQAFVDEEFGDK